MDVVVPSREIIRYHSQLHEQRCPSSHALAIPCTCRPARSHLIVCDTCDEVIFVVVKDNNDVCPHAAPLLR